MVERRSGALVTKYECGPLWFEGEPRLEDSESVFGRD